MQKQNPKRKVRPKQHQKRPGLAKEMKPQPVFDDPYIKGSDKLKDKIAFITGGDSGIGRATAMLFAKEGADVAIAYLSETTDADDTKQLIEEKYKQRCLLIKGDLSKEGHCKLAIEKAIKEFGGIDILVNNAGLHYESEGLEDISIENLLKTFATNIFSFFWITKAALPYMKKGSSIINSASVTAYRGSANLIDYSSTKGAIVSFTRSLSASLAKKEFV